MSDPTAVTGSITEPVGKVWQRRAVGLLRKYSINNNFRTEMVRGSVLQIMIGFLCLRSAHGRDGAMEIDGIKMSMKALP